MVLSIIYDKEIMAKVFQLRDSERYTNSTQTSLEVDFLNNRRDYVTVTLSANVLKHLDKSSVAFYCDDTLVGVTACNEGTSTVTATAHVPYGYHKYYAKYMGNAQCLSSKSGIVELEVTEPDLPKTTLGLTVTGLDSSSWVSSVSGATITLSLTNYNDDSSITGKSIKIYVNNDAAISYTLDNASVNLSSVLSDYNSYVGQLVVRAEFEGDAEYIGDDAEIKFYVGYNVTATPKYAKIGVGDNAVVNVQLSKYNGAAVANKTVKLNG